MTRPIDSSGLGGTLADVVAALGQAQAASGDQKAQEPPVGTGEAADGRIRVRATLPGRIESLELEPSVLRLGGDELAQQIEAAVNAALADLQGRAVTAAGPADLGALTDQLKDIQADAERQFAKLTTSLIEAQEQIARRAGD
ncbi:YbaB/EbfC family nucleoid-associated protein [Actinoplanes sp. Pm04-4]|uniref:YbaB/EbfC family nucleoid-associated protein n=1 Tax=Paractinoplanes pyxinae TaxID=2997416 RepID=A0ABT4AUT4_9ACTN|nr:YbaB/EbfC family nucleoid-associated protein [Actinoplanes pyxinae]MCY1138005.1 YbaB/EbfC family nucleoid-associated protein [Actinoplanes pyxinae]